MEGTRFGKLVITKNTNLYYEKQLVWKLKCDCGSIVYLTGPTLLRGESCCGCTKEKSSFLTLNTTYK